MREWMKRAVLTAACSKTVVAGEVAEWLMAPVLKTGIPERVSGVRIPPSPPDSLGFTKTRLHSFENRHNSAGLARGFLANL